MEQNPATRETSIMIRGLPWGAVSKPGARRLNCLADFASHQMKDGYLLKAVREVTASEMRKALHTPGKSQTSDEWPIMRDVDAGEINARHN
jgi:hypothetical protein